MSQIRSHIEYLMQIYYILVLILQSKLMKNLATMTGFNADLRMTRDSGLIFWATLYIYIYIYIGWHRKMKVLPPKMFLLLSIISDKIFVEKYQYLEVAQCPIT